MKLLILRPQPGADATAKRTAAFGFEPLVMPLFAVEAVSWTIEENPPYDALLLTSAQAIWQGGAQGGIKGGTMDGAKWNRLLHLPVYAVGAGTAAAARGAGLLVAAAGNAGAQAIIAAAQRNGHRRLLWLTGAHHIPVEVPPNMVIDKRIIYRAAALAVPEDFGEYVSQAGCILLHSPRAARHFRALCEQRKLALGTISIAAFSANVADAAGEGWQAKIIADRPNDRALIAAIARGPMPKGDPPA